MAKINFNKLNIKKEKINISAIEFNGQKIEVVDYLPIQEKLDLIGEVINLAADGNRFYNDLKTKMYYTIKVIEAYTNINFTEKQLEDIPKLYDLVHTSGLIDAIFAAIPKGERISLYSYIYNCSQGVYNQMNSAYGMVSDIANDFSQMEMNADNINKKLADPNNMAFLKDVVTKLG